MTVSCVGYERTDVKIDITGDTAMDPVTIKPQDTNIQTITVSALDLSDFDLNQYSRWDVRKEDFINWFKFECPKCGKNNRWVPLIRSKTEPSRFWLCTKCHYIYSNPNAADEVLNAYRRMQEQKNKKDKKKR